MITLTNNKSAHSLKLDDVARINNISANAFEGVVESLIRAGFIEWNGAGDLKLKVAPDKITVWQIVESANSFIKEYSHANTEGHQIYMVIMLSKWRGIIQNMIVARLTRFKLSTWSRKAQTIYL